MDTAEFFMGTHTSYYIHEKKEYSTESIHIKVAISASAKI